MLKDWCGSQVTSCRTWDEHVEDGLLVAWKLCWNSRVGK